MFTINAEVRKEQGKGASRRLRAANKFPAIIYGGAEAPIAIELDHDAVMNMQAKAEFYSEVLTIVVDGKEVKVKARLYSVTRSSRSCLTSTSFARNRKQVEEKPRQGGVFLWDFVIDTDGSRRPDKAFTLSPGKRFYFPPDVRRCSWSRRFGGVPLMVKVSVAGSQKTRSPSSMASKLMVNPPPLPANLVN